MPVCRLVLALLALLGALLPRTLAAGGFHTPDFGTRRCGMLAVMGKPDDLSAIFANPAGLVLVPGTQIYTAAQLTVADLAVRLYDSEGVLRPDHDLGPETNWAIVPFLGASTDFGVERLRVALALYAPNLYGADLPKDEPTRYHMTRGFFFALHTTASAAFAVTDQLAIGASVSAVYLRLEGQQYMNPLVLADPDRRFDPPEDLRGGDLKLDLFGEGWTWDWNVGLLFHPYPTLGIGLSFTSGADVEMEGDVTMTPVANAAGRQKVGQRTRMAIPFSLRAGINWEFVPGFELGLDVAWWHYQVFQEQVMTLDAPLVGMGGPDAPLRTPKAYGNAWNVSVGVLYRVIDPLDLMVGYQYDTSPIPERTLSLDNLNRDLQSVAVGVRWRIIERLRVGFTFMRSWLAAVDVQDSVMSPPTNMKGHGGMTHFAMDAMYRF